MATSFALDDDLEEVIASIAAAARSELRRLEQKHKLIMSSAGQHLHEACDYPQASSSGESSVEKKQSFPEPEEAKVKHISDKIHTHLEETEAQYRKDLLAKCIRRLPCFIPLEDKSLHGVVHHQVFHTVVAVVVVLNIFLIGWETQEFSTRLVVADGLDFASKACAVFFWIELALRLAADKKDFFCIANTGVLRWNAFDTCLVLLSVVEIIASSSQPLRTLTILKMLRIFRIFRFFRFFRILSELAMCVLESTKSLMVVLTLFSLVLYTFAISISFLATTYLKSVADTSPSDWWDQLEHHTDDHVRDIWNTFGNVWRTAYTLYAVALGGVNWSTVCNPLFQTGGLLPALLLCYVTFMILAMLNVVAGLFVENSLRFAESQRSIAVMNEVERAREYTSRLMDFFSFIDAEMDGQLSVEELLVLLHDETLSAYLRVLDFQIDDMEQLEHFVRLLDVDESGALSLEEFVKGCQKFRGPAQATDVHQILKETRSINKRLISLHGQGVEFNSRLQLLESSGKLHTDILQSLPRGTELAVSWSSEYRI